MNILIWYFMVLILCFNVLTPLWRTTDDLQGRIVVVHGNINCTLDDPDLIEHWHALMTKENVLLCYQISKWTRLKKTVLTEVHYFLLNNTKAWTAGTWWSEQSCSVTCNSLDWMDKQQKWTVCLSLDGKFLVFIEFTDTHSLSVSLRTDMLKKNGYIQIGGQQGWK